MRYVNTWIISWAKILDGVIGVLSLGFWEPMVTFSVYCLFTEAREERELAKKNKENK